MCGCRAAAGLLEPFREPASVCRGALVDNEAAYRMRHLVLFRAGLSASYRTKNCITAGH